MKLMQRFTSIQVWNLIFIFGTLRMSGLFEAHGCSVAWVCEPDVGLLTCFLLLFCWALCTWCPPAPAPGFQPHQEFSSECSYCKRPVEERVSYVLPLWAIVDLFLRSFSPVPFFVLSPKFLSRPPTSVHTPCTVAAGFVRWVRACGSTTASSLLTTAFLSLFVGCRYGSRCPRMTCDDYDALLDAGWMRCGNYVYRTMNDRTCCPNLPIRLVARYTGSGKHAGVDPIAGVCQGGWLF